MRVPLGRPAFGRHPPCPLQGNESCFFCMVPACRRGPTISGAATAAGGGGLPKSISEMGRARITPPVHGTCSGCRKLIWADLVCPASRLRRSTNVPPCATSRCPLLRLMHRPSSIVQGSCVATWELLAKPGNHALECRRFRPDAGLGVAARNVSGEVQQGACPTRLGHSIVRPAR